MRFALMIEPQQGTTYADQLAVAKHAEAGGFETLFRSDHYSSFPGPDDNPTTDAWACLAGLARDTTRIGLGTLVSPVTFRLPGNLAKAAATARRARCGSPRGLRTSSTSRVAGRSGLRIGRRSLTRPAVRPGAIQGAWPVRRWSERSSDGTTRRSGAARESS